MNPATLFFCICILRTSMTNFTTATMPTGNGDDNNQVSPLVMLIYRDASGFKPAAFADLETAKKNNLKLPPDNSDPAFVVLLCGVPSELGGKNGTFTIRDLVQQIDVNTEYRACEHYLKPSARQEEIVGTYEIGFTYETTTTHLQLDQLNTANEQLLDVYAEFVEENRINVDPSKAQGVYFTLEYDYDLILPLTGSSYVIAHMHSDDYNKECPDMELGKEEFLKHRKDFDFDKFSRTPEKYVWRQLLPMQDFAGIYTTAATCTYLNYVLVHEDVLENLRLLEKSIKNVADAAGVLLVSTGTLVGPDSDDIASESVRSEPSISMLFWKMVIYKDPRGKEFAILMVFHNANFGIAKICNENGIGREWGWPEIDRNHGDAGTIYYCPIDTALAKVLALPVINHEAAGMSPLDLRKFHGVKMESFVVGSQNPITGFESAPNLTVESE